MWVSGGPALLLDRECVSVGKVAATEHLASHPPTSLVSTHLLALDEHGESGRALEHVAFKQDGAVDSELCGGGEGGRDWRAKLEASVPFSAPRLPRPPSPPPSRTRPGVGVCSVGGSGGGRTRKRARHQPDRWHQRRRKTAARPWAASGRREWDRRPHVRLVPAQRLPHNSVVSSHTRRPGEAERRAEQRGGGDGARMVGRRDSASERRGTRAPPPARPPATPTKGALLTRIIVAPSNAAAEDVGAGQQGARAHERRQRPGTPGISAARHLWTSGGGGGDDVGGQVGGGVVTGLGKQRGNRVGIGG